MKDYLSIIGYIDEGNFGTIDLARKVGGIDDNIMYAVKTVNAPKDEQKSNEDYSEICNNELEMFKAVKDSAFFIQLKYVCKTESLYRFVMDYKAKGTMFHYLTIVKYLTMDEVIVCVGEIVTAIEYLHKRKIVYRDLKLENILIDDDNHILLTDFGLARQLKPGEKFKDPSGTISYMAPEIFKEKSYEYEVDWWSLGIVTYELLIGHSPFVFKLQDDISSRVLQSRILNDEVSLNAIKLRTKNSSICDFIDKLLQKNPAKRLGTGFNGFEQVKRHPYFSQINWLAVRLRAYKCLNRQIKEKTLKMYKDAKNIPVEGSRTTFRREYFYTAPELKDPEEVFIPIDGLTVNEKVQIDKKPVQKLQVYVPIQTQSRGWFRGFRPDQDGHFKDSVSATLMEMLKKSISVDCNLSNNSIIYNNNNNNNNNDISDIREPMKETIEPIRKSKTIKKSSYSRFQPYILRRTIRNQRETRQG